MSLASESGTPGRKEGGRYTGGGKRAEAWFLMCKKREKKLRKVAGTEIKRCGWWEVCTPIPPPRPSPSPSPIQSEMVLRSQETVSLPLNSGYLIKMMTSSLHQQNILMHSHT